MKRSMISFRIVIWFFLINPKSVHIVKTLLFKYRVYSLSFKLLQKDPHRRLGYKGGIARIQDHSWLSEVDWKMSYDKKIKPIYRPPQEAQQRAQKDIMNAMEE